MSTNELTDEIWVHVPEYMGAPHVLVSNLGRAKMLAHTTPKGKNISARIMKRIPNSNGTTLSYYVMDELTGKRHNVEHGKLVLMAFGIAPPRQRARVEYINGDRNDNSLANVRWWVKAPPRHRKASTVPRLPKGTWGKTCPGSNKAPQYVDPDDMAVCQHCQKTMKVEYAYSTDADGEVSRPLETRHEMPTHNMPETVPGTQLKIKRRRYQYGY